MKAEPGGIHQSFSKNQLAWQCRSFCYHPDCFYSNNVTKDPWKTPRMPLCQRWRKILGLCPNCFMAYTKQVWHGKTKIWVTTLRSFTWTSPAMLVNKERLPKMARPMNLGGGNRRISLPLRFQTTDICQKHNFSSLKSFICTNLFLSYYLTQAVSSPTSDLGKEVLPACLAAVLLFPRLCRGPRQLNARKLLIVHWLWLVLLHFQRIYPANCHKEMWKKA